MDRQQLLHQLIQNLQGLYRGMHHASDFQKDSIPFGQKAALFTIASHKTINVKQLANILHITSGAATQHIESLVKVGLVEREIDPNDRRNVIIKLSAHGKSLIQKLEKSRMKMLEELFSDITDKELKAYIDVMEKVNLKLK